MFREKHPLSWLYHRNSNPIVSDESDTGVLFELKEYPDVPVIRLPHPAASKITKILSTRRTCREFTDVSLDLAQLSAILKHSYGWYGVRVVEGIEFCTRPVPSAGALYPLELYVIANRVDGLPRGVFHYSLADHVLEQINRKLESPEDLLRIFLGQDEVSSASVIVVITAVFERIMRKYGDRGYRFLLIEAGHVAQNTLLSAEELKLGSLPVGGFIDLALARCLALDPELELPIYAIALGNRPRKLSKR